MTSTHIVEDTVRHFRNNARTAPWTTKPGITDRLIELHREGVSFSPMADILSAEFGLSLSRNQCIGKARRLNLPQRHPVEPRGIRLRAPRKSRAKPHAPMPRLRNGRFGPKVSVALPVEDVVLEPELPKLDLPRRDWRTDNLPVLALKPWHCRWPYGEAPFQFCGRRRLDGCSYCAGHLALSLRAGSGA